MRAAIILLLVAIFLHICCLPLLSLRVDNAVQLLMYDAKGKKFSLNPAAVELIRSLKQPIHVISAIGDARVGKSTAMNIIRHIWENAETKDFVEVFKTGASFVPVTRGVWISVVLGKDRMERVILDVEGTDLGDDVITDHLSMFTALMSSGMNFFMRDAVKTHAIDFLFRVSRLSDTLFEEEAIKNFPRLRVILRGALDTPEGMRMDDYVRDALGKPKWKDGSDEKRKVIGKQFPRHYIEVSTIESLENRSIFKDFEQLSKNDYMKSMHALAEDTKLFPVKKTLNGGLMDGTALAELASKLVETMNNDTWLEFGNVYLMVEKHLCDRRYKEIVEPEIGGNATSLKNFLQVGFTRFEKGCALEEYAKAIKLELMRIAKVKGELEDKQRKLEEETKRRKDEEEKRIRVEKKFKKDKENMDKALDVEKQKSEKAEQEAAKKRQEFLQMNEEVVSLQNQIKESNDRLERMQEDGGFGEFLKFVANTVFRIIAKVIPL